MARDGEFSYSNICEARKQKLSHWKDYWRRNARAQNDEMILGKIVNEARSSSMVMSTTVYG